MLYFVATPIGNLADMSFRAVETLKKVDVIACEDTRNSLKLLNYYDIKKQLIAYHKNNERSSADGIIKLLKEGRDVAVISDSGMPVISDPGEILAKRLVEEKLDFTVVPGPNAGLSALILSGFDAKSFAFVGFLSDNNKHRRAQLENIKSFNGSVIFYIAPHNLKKDIKFIYDELGERKACLVGEITKLFEKKFFFTLGKQFEIEPKGEFVLIVEGAPEERASELMSLTPEEHIKYYEAKGLSRSEAIKKTGRDRKVKNPFKNL